MVQPPIMYPHIVVGLGMTLGATLLLTGLLVVALLCGCLRRRLQKAPTKR